MPVAANGTHVVPLVAYEVKIQGIYISNSLRIRIRTKHPFDLLELHNHPKPHCIRFSNRTRERSGTLWEERFKRVIVESGTAGVLWSVRNLRVGV
jgi:hypothetical protein